MMGTHLYTSGHQLPFAMHCCLQSGGNVAEDAELPVSTSAGSAGLSADQTATLVELDLLHHRAETAELAAAAANRRAAAAEALVDKLKVGGSAAHSMIRVQITVWTTAQVPAFTQTVFERNLWDAWFDILLTSLSVVAISGLPRVWGLLVHVMLLLLLRPHSALHSLQQQCSTMHLGVISGIASTAYFCREGLLIVHALHRAATALLVVQVDLSDAQKRSKDLGWQVKMMAGGGAGGAAAAGQQGEASSSRAITQVGRAAKVMWHRHHS